MSKQKNEPTVKELIELMKKSQEYIKRCGDKIRGKSNSIDDLMGGVGSPFNSDFYKGFGL